MDSKIIKRLKRKKKMYVTIAIVAVVAVIALWNQPVYRKYEVSTSKVEQGFRIVQISDLHSSVYGKEQKRLLNKIKAVEPDIIVFTGDIVDDVTPEEGAYDLLKGLSEYPLYYVSGNHEAWHPSTTSLFETIESLGVVHLYDHFEEIDINGEVINIGGIIDPAGIGEKRTRGNGKYNIRPVDEALNNTNISELDSEKFTLFLSHRPEYYNIYKQYPLDLVLCGHAHGGQVRIPFLLNGLYAPNQGLFPDYAGGLYDEDDCTMIVSRGLSFNWYLPRVFNPPEVVVIDVVGGEE